MADNNPSTQKKGLKIPTELGAGNETLKGKDLSDQQIEKIDATIDNTDLYQLLGLCIIMIFIYGLNSWWLIENDSEGDTMGITIIVSGILYIIGTTLLISNSSSISFIGAIFVISACLINMCVIPTMYLTDDHPDHYYSPTVMCSLPSGFIASLIAIYLAISIYRKSGKIE